ncbi:MAG: hypothetical protein KC613_00340 [Myxococcales bacterium]|nr:hypothetical protein [Myxococcales bacterium]MCB9525879.1 hypothetical protein [Myxococcales bacterium]
MIEHRHAPQMVLVSDDVPAGETPAPAGEPAVGRVRYRKASDVTDAELVQALRDSGFALKAAAAALNISRTALYGLIDRSPTLRKASDLGEAELRRAFEASGGDLAQMAARLEVSPAGLKARLSALQIG